MRHVICVRVYPHDRAFRIDTKSMRANRGGEVDAVSMSKSSWHIYLSPPLRHCSVGCGSLSGSACLPRLQKPWARSVGGGVVWTNLCYKGIPGSPSELRLRGICRREVIRNGCSCNVDVATEVDGGSVVKLIAAASKVRGVTQGTADGVHLGYE